MPRLAHGGSVEPAPVAGQRHRHERSPRARDTASLVRLDVATTRSVVPRLAIVGRGDDARPRDLLHMMYVRYGRACPSCVDNGRANVDARDDPLNVITTGHGACLDARIVVLSCVGQRQACTTKPLLHRHSEPARSGRNFPMRICATKRSFCDTVWPHHEGGPE